MANFGAAIGTVLAHEGGYVNDPHDAGGETNFGISKRSYPQVDIGTLTREGAEAIYRRDWWDRHRYGEIDDQGVATKVFDLAVNMGPTQAHKILQRALCRSGQRVKVDGILGPATMGCVNQASPATLLDALRSEAAAFYMQLVNRKPSQARFLNGWMRRALS